MDGKNPQADIAAVTEVVLAYYDGRLAGDEGELARAFTLASASSETSKERWSGRPWRSFWLSARRRPVTREPTCGGIDGLPP